MIDVKDLNPIDDEKLYRYEKVLSDGTGTGQYEYFKYSPGDLARPATAINRRLLMAMQGFISAEIFFGHTGEIVQTNQDGDTLTTVFNEDGSIEATFASGEAAIKKTTVFNNDGTISEIVTGAYIPDRPEINGIFKVSPNMGLKIIE